MQLSCKETQKFGANATDTYSKGGLKGHSGVDSSCGFGSPILSYWDNEYVYKVLTKENPSADGSGFTGVFTIVEHNGIVFEFLYGHCNPAPNLLGKIISRGALVGTEANNGEVYSGGVRITLDMQRNGDTRGSHRHDQARLLKKESSVRPGVPYLSSLGGGIFHKDGYFYAMVDIDNGFKGCFDWTQPFKEIVKPVHEFQSVLNYGARGRSVQKLQEILKHEGYFPKEQECTGYFGDMTANALIKFQVANGITDFLGEKNIRLVRMGLKTRELLNKKYGNI